MAAAQVGSANAGRALRGAVADGHPSLKVGNATLWGGNLTVLCSLVGTPWLPRVKGGVLFMEDVNEHPYRIERQLTQLLHAGILGEQKAVLLGSFNRYQLGAARQGLQAADGGGLAAQPDPHTQC